MKIIDVKTNEMHAYQNLKKEALKGQFDNKLVVISNDLARQNSKMTLEEEQLLHCIFSQLDPYGKNNPKVTLKKSELFEKLGLKSSNRYSETKKKLRSLLGKSLVDFTVDDVDYVGFVLTDFKSDHKSEDIEVYMNPRFMPYVEQLVSHYTKLQLDSIVQFDSKYSLILYKYLSSWAGDHPERALMVSTKELKELFGLSKEDYVYHDKFNRALFEKYTLDTAIDEINEKVPGFDVVYKKSKKGNRVQGYIIHWIDRNRIAYGDGVVPGQTTIEDFL